jgi:hypothetical protein
MWCADLPLIPLFLKTGIAAVLALIPPFPCGRHVVAFNSHFLSLSGRSFAVIPTFLKGCGAGLPEIPPFLKGVGATAAGGFKI